MPAGTYGFITEEILSDLDNGETVDFNRYLQCVDENDCVEFVNVIPNTIAYIGFALFSRNADTLDTVAVFDSDGTAVQPTIDSIASFSYPFTRPLYLNVDNAFLPQISNFLKYGFSQIGQDLVESPAGYVPVYTFPPDYQEALLQIEDML